MLHALLSLATAGPHCCSGGVHQGNEPIILGAIDAEQIKDGLVQVAPSLARCVPETGVAALRWTILNDGQVTDVRVKKTTYDDGVTACVAEAMLQAEMPEPVGEGIAIVSYRFVLHPTPEAGATLSPDADSAPPAR